MTNKNEIALNDFLKDPTLRGKLLFCIVGGFSSGLPLFVFINLLQIWMNSYGIEKALIGSLNIIQLSYTIKFLWAPFIDAYALPFLGRRKGWLFVTQVIILLVIASYGFINPSQNIQWVFILSLILTFFSATFDSVIDGFRREILADNELGLGNSIHVSAYRLSALIPGSLALFLADPLTIGLSWQSVFFIVSLFMLPGILLSVFYTEPKTTIPEVKSFEERIISPFKDFIDRKGVKSTALVILFIICYKLGDSMTTALASVFYVDMGYSLTDIALVAKNAALWPSIVSSIIGGILMYKIGINKGLWLFGLVQMGSILGFVFLSSMGPFVHISHYELMLLAGVVAFEYIGVGLGGAAYIAYIARETNPAFAVTQLALLAALSAVPRTFVNSFAGKLIEMLGYVDFFWLCFLLAIPGMILLKFVAPWNGEKEVKQ